MTDVKKREKASEEDQDIPSPDTDIFQAAGDMETFDIGLDESLPPLDETLDAEDAGSIPEEKGELNQEEPDFLMQEPFDPDLLAEEKSAADYEAAAISAAIAMEKNAIQLYSDRASTAADPNEKALYKWLAAWERQHLNFLAEIDKELTEEVWYDNNFWPF